MLEVNTAQCVRQPGIFIELGFGGERHAPRPNGWPRNNYDTGLFNAPTSAIPLHDEPGGVR
jgi:hypothetical protein